MKKKIILSVCLLCTLLIFSACSKESKGVPESVILQDAESRAESCTNYKIKHNVDTTSHIDEVHFVAEYKGPYGSSTTTTPYIYQYNKSNDLWTLIDEHDSTTTHTINEEAYISNSPWIGTSDTYSDCRYSITFKEIDTDRMLATISYEIDFQNDKIPDLSKTDTVKIIDTFGTYILIDYSYRYHIGNSIYTTKEESLWLWLDINSGLKPS